MNTNIIKIIVPLCISVLLLACADKQPKENLIPEDIMLGLLVNMHQLEARFETVPTNNDSLPFIMNYNYGLLFEKFNTTKAKFDTTLNYYQNNPKLMDELYEKVVDSLSTIEALTKALPDEKNRIDSNNQAIDTLIK